MMWQILTIAKLLAETVPQASLLCAALSSGDASLGRGGAQCSKSLLQNGAEQNTCHWVHAYRSTGAQVQFDTLRAEVEGCLGADAALPADTQVNHPDSYILHQYEGQGLRVALSLKDKAGLSQSLVFLSISAAP